MRELFEKWERLYEGTARRPRKIKITKKKGTVDQQELATSITDSLNSHLGEVSKMIKNNGYGWEVDGRPVVDKSAPKKWGYAVVEGKVEYDHGSAIAKAWDGGDVKVGDGYFVLTIADFEKDGEVWATFEVNDIFPTEDDGAELESGSSEVWAEVKWDGSGEFIPEKHTLGLMRKAIARGCDDLPEYKEI